MNFKNIEFDINNNNPNKRIFEIHDSKYTLQGSQPYVLSGTWPNNFIPNGTKIINDTSMNFIMGYNILNQDKYANYNHTS